MDEFTVCGLYDLSRTRAAAIFENVKYPWAILGCLEAFTAALGRALPRNEFEEREQGVFVCGLYDLSRTRAAAIFENVKYPWAILGSLEAFTAALGRALPRAEFEEREAGVFVARDAVIADSAVLCAPSIVDHETELRPGAYLRGGVIIGKNAVIGNSCEIKNALLFDGAQVPHFNYVGDSVLGYYAHLGAGAVTSNFKSDGSCITIHAGDICFDTARKKVGSFLGDFAEIGCGAVLCPGTIVGRGATVYPQSMVRGYVPPNHIYKDACRVVRKQAR